MPTRLACLLALALLVPAPADGQVRAERDAAGRLVLTNRQNRGPAPAPPPAARPAPTPIRSAAARYEPLVLEHAARQGLRPALVRAVIQAESGFDPRARSVKGAMGLMQLMPDTARELGVRDPWDPVQNVRGGTTYLRRLLDRFDGDETLALAAYNAGATVVDRYAGVPPYPETRAYVERVGRAAGPAPPAAERIWATEEVVDGRVVRRFSNLPPRER
jgi:soluble lytic murein transglycosylase-like protein